MKVDYCKQCIYWRYRFWAELKHKVNWCDLHNRYLSDWDDGTNKEEKVGQNIYYPCKDGIHDGK